MPRSLAVLGLVLVPMVAGCDDRSSTPVTELREYLGGQILVAPGREGTEAYLRVELIRPAPAGVRDCHPLPDTAAASINGARMAAGSRGAFSFTDPARCTNPEFFRSGVPLAAGGIGGTLVLDDGRTRLTVVIPELFVTRELKLVAPAGGRLRPGEEVVLEHSAPTDTLGPGYAGIAGVIVRPRPSGYPPIAEIDREVSGPRLQFRLPEDLSARVTTAVDVSIDLSFEVFPRVERLEASAPGRPAVSLGILSRSLPATLIPR
jgi:hypothetical protein